MTGLTIWQIYGKGTKNLEGVNLHATTAQIFNGELEKLIAEWPTEVVKRQKKDNRKVGYLIFGSIPQIKSVNC